MIEVSSLHKSFGDKQVLKDISVTFEPGKTNLIIGQSGSGKTVLMKCMLGLHQPDSGRILFDGRNFFDMNYGEQKSIRKEIGMVFQGSALFDSMTVEENIKFPLTMFSGKSHSEIKERADFCLQRVNLINANSLYPSEISGGMQKRVAIARAIALNPKYLFCDEPNSGLDPKTALLIDELIREITEEYNITTIINTHDMNSVLEIGDKVVYILKGEKWWEGTGQDILSTNNKEVNEFVYASKFIKQLRDR